jgi:hypothetical protein
LRKFTSFPRSRVGTHVWTLRVRPVLHGLSPDAERPQACVPTRSVGTRGGFFVCAIWALCGVAISSPGARADIRFETTKANIGEVRASLPLEHHFTFVNNGTSPIEIVEARPSCGCLKPQLGQRVFAPGEHGVIPLVIHTLGQPAGPHEWELTLIYRDGKTLKRQVLQLSARVKTDVSVQPASLTVVARGPLSHDIQLADMRAAPLKIVRVETTSPGIEAVAQPLVAGEFGGFVGKIQVHITDAMPEGRHEESIVIYTDDPVYGEMRVPVTVVKSH